VILYVRLCKLTLTTTNALCTRNEQSHRVTLQLNALELSVEQSFVVAMLDMAQSITAAAPAQEALLKQTASDSSTDNGEHYNHFVNVTNTSHYAVHSDWCATSCTVLSMYILSRSGMAFRITYKMEYTDTSIRCFTSPWFRNRYR
jgi:hypothetical protein